jgi:Flp pilus assembly protein TadG
VGRALKQVQQSRLVRSEAGQAAVEFALTIVMTLLLIFGIIDFSRAIYTASVIQWAAQQGARTAIIDSSPAVVETAVHDRMAGLDTTQVFVTVSQPITGIMQVDVTYEFEFIVPIVAQITGDSIEMNASASMVVN